LFVLLLHRAKSIEMHAHFPGAGHCRPTIHPFAGASRHDGSLPPVPMFKNACFFRVAEDFVLPDLAALERVLHKTPFVPCGPTHPGPPGWGAPRGNKSRGRAETTGGPLILKKCTEKRAVPASAVKSAVEEKVERYKTETGNERVPAKLKKEFK